MADPIPILHDQNRWWSDPKHRETLQFPYRRPIYEHIREYLGDSHDSRALALLGPRQVGKTTLLRQLADDLLRRDWPPGNITFFDFSDERLVAAVSPREILAAAPIGLSAEYPRIFLLDEIQEAVAWQRWLKSAVDHVRRGSGQPARFIVTGSAATSLREGGVESGQGRWDEVPIEGLTFAEFVRLSVPVEEDLSKSVAREPQLVERYLEIGGFPAHVRTEPPREARRQVREDIADRAILRDLRHAGVELDRVRRLFVYLVAGSGQVWSQGKRADDLEANRKSVGEWLSLLEGTRLVARLEQDSHSRSRARAQLRSQPKIFASDHGLISAFSSYPEPLEVPEVRGRVFEAVVFRHLRELVRAGQGSLSFARLDDDLELDFLVRYPRHTVGIEVTASTEARSRKLTRAAEVMQKTGIDRRLLIHGGLEAGHAKDIELVPFHEFLMAPQRYAGGPG